MLNLIAVLQTAPVDFNLPLVAFLAAFIATPTKILVDVIRNMLEGRLPSKFVPAIGIVVAYAMCIISLIATSYTLTGAIYAQCFLASLGAQVLAMTASGMQNKANKTEERVDKALLAEPGTTKEELDNQVFNRTGDGK